MPKPLPIVYAPTTRRKPVSGRVRCLGPGDTEHTFLSPDRVGVRVCPRCARVQERLSRMAECRTEQPH